MRQPSGDVAFMTLPRIRCLRTLYHQLGLKGADFSPSTRTRPCEPRVERSPLSLRPMGMICTARAVTLVAQRTTDASGDVVRADPVWRPEPMHGSAAVGPPPHEDWHS